MSQRTGQSSSALLTTNDRDRQRQKYRAKVAKALNEDDDPLAAYHQFIQWTIKNYGDKDPESGLKELLKEATDQFKEDDMYKKDLRYLKMWALHARQLDRKGAIAVFASLVENDIGTSYAALYEDYANLLEHDGKHSEAEKIYLKGIERSVRPLERLKTRYKEFQARAAQKLSSSTASSSKQSARTTSSSSATTSASSSNVVTFNSTAAQRYALMLAPPPPGKRPEQLRFDMKLLFTDDNVEYSIQEARARSMGLLGKKWGPPPSSELPIFMSPGTSSSFTSTPVDFNDDDRKSTRMNLRRRSAYGGGAEPTVTINTKEALADVFGMFNSPDRTHKLDVPGSKHAPLKKIEPATPMVPIKQPMFSKENEVGKTPGSAFRPMSDENAGQNRMTPGAKFSVFTEDQNKTPFVTPRNGLGSKDLPTPSFTFTAAAGENSNPPLFSKVFNPPQSESKPPLAPGRDVFTDDHGKPSPKARPNQMHERARSHDVLPTAPPVFTPFKDENANKTPFKVFSRPPEQSENPFKNPFAPKTPTAVFTPFMDGAQQQQRQEQPTFTPFGNKQQRTFTPFGDKTPFAEKTPFSEKRPFAEKPVTPALPLQEDEETEMLDPEEEEYEAEYEEEGEEVYEVERDASMEGPDGVLEEEQGEEYYGDQEHLDQYQTPVASEQDEYEQYQREVPLGGRFGAFNVMTPITERTFEMASTGGRTPSERYSRPMDGEGSPISRGGFVPFLRDEMVAAADAERLAAELREGGSMEAEGEEEGMEEYEENDEQAEHFGSDGTTQERTGGLSLVDALTLKSKFRPDNPCNPFDPPVLSTLLSLIPTDPHFYDIRDQAAETLPQLQKHFKKTARKGSSVAVGDIFPLNLNGNRFQLSEKLGEGGFGSVYKARDLGMRNSSDDEDSDMEDFDEDDEEGASFVALKVVSPRNLWEYHVLRRLHSALPPNLRRSLVLPHALYAFADESFLVMDYCPQGMLLDIVNNSTSAGISQAGACLDELLVIFFTIELLRLLEGMHGVGFVHGDLKIDNCLIRLEDVPGGASAWSPQYSPTGESGWSYKGLKVIDFGRTIDTRLFPQGQEFVAEWDVDERDCFEIQEGRSWTYQTDYYGLAGIVYCMLFGKYMSQSAIAMVQEPDGRRRFKVGTPLKRYWQSEIWNKLFDMLLNPVLVRDDGTLPLCEEMAEMRSEMEVWLQANCNRTSGTLKGLLKKVEMSCYV